MKGSDGFVQAYNAQIAIEPALGLIVAQAVTQQANDKNQLVPMINRVKRQSGQKVEEVLADSGYGSEENLRQAAKKRVTYLARANISTIGWCLNRHEGEFRSWPRWSTG